MKKALGILIFICFALVMYTGNALATPSYDYGDAPSSYGSASHADNSWQQLGSIWNSETAPRVPSDTSDDGVSWSINGDIYGHNDIAAGDDVTFKFTVYKELWGKHWYDYIGVWIDWDQDGQFVDETAVLKDYWAFHSTPGYVYDDNPANVYKDFFYTINDISVLEGDYWLRARVVCDPDVLGSNPATGTPYRYDRWGNLIGGGPGPAPNITLDLSSFQPTGYYSQGEVEDWQFHVVGRTPPVPEPTTILLLGFGLIGVAAVRRFKR
jgi:hypothetical protein